MAVLTLTAADVAGRGSWLWRLFDGRGQLLAHHQVSVDTSSWEWLALADLPAGVAQQSDPADRLGSEAVVVDEVGHWAAKHVLGPIAARLADAAPVAVSVVVPAEESWLLGLPLGVARVGDSSLATRRVVFAGSLAGQEAATKDSMGERLRVLAVFSVPAGQSLLDLRRERKGLADLVGELVGGGKARAIDLRVLQYGATPQRLQDALAEGEGWDVVHFAGHGAAGRLVLEDEAGQAHVVETADLVEWLREARHRLKLVSLSACSSAAFTVAETLQALGVKVPDVGGSAEMAAASHGLAMEVVRRAECSVVAMRYPVVDDFAIAFGLAFFEGLWDKQLDTAAATGWAVKRTARIPPTPGAPALSPFTPAVFGPEAPGLRLVPPVQTARAAVDTKMAGFDPEPARFVGRIGVMTRANAALAPRSGRQGVLFHGMAGAGKTACALELAYGQRDNFSSLVWCRCPREGSDDAAASDKLADLARRLDLALGVAVADKAHDPKLLAEVLEALTEAMEQRAVLVVIDNAESLLAANGAWLDPRWEALVGALIAHGGRGRVVLTSRRPPARLPAGVVVEAVHALGRDEAVLLARQLPNLARLLDGDQVPTRDGRPLVRAVLEATGGHPKLLELADAHAGAPQVLESMLADASRVWAGAGVDPSGFLTQATAGADPVASYVDLVRTWATQALAGLDEAAVLAAQLLCRAHEADRTSVIVEANWADLWHRLGRPDPVPDHRPLLAAVARAALVEENISAGASEATFTVHPLVAEAIGAATPEAVATAVDYELAAFWEAVLAGARDAEASGAPATGAVVRAASQGVVYLLRLERWGRARTLIEHAINRDSSPVGMANAVALLRQVAAQAAGTDEELNALGVLARALADTNPEESEQIQRRVESEAAAAGLHHTATASAGQLVNLLVSTGRHRLALEVIERKAGHTARAGLGPWTRIGDEVWRLQILQILGEDELVLTEVPELVERMEGLPDQPEANEAVFPWNVRETLFDLGRSAAQRLHRWDESLAWLDKMVESKQARGAPELERARTAFNAYGPLLRTGRIGETRDLLHRCRAVFEEHGDYPMVAMCLTALADLEDTLDHLPQALALERMAVRFKYLQGDPDSIGVSHTNLGSFLGRPGGDLSLSIAHHLAAGILSALTGSGAHRNDLRAIQRKLVAGAVAPTTFEALCEAVDSLEGVHFRELVEALGGNGQELLTAVLAAARAIPFEELYGDQLAAWESGLELLVAAASGNPHARAHLDATLARNAEQADWATLVERLGRVRDGERDRAALLEELDPIDTTITTRALDALEGHVSLDPAPESFQPLLAAVVTLARLHRQAGALTPDDEEAVRQVDTALGEMARSDEWGALASRLRELAHGATSVTWDGLDAIDTAIVCSVLRRIDAGPEGQGPAR